MAEAPVVDCTRCDGCGLCIDVCACNVLILVEHVVTVVEAERCDWCADCEAVCIAGAITCPFEIVIQD
jgi:MinD superfamily P-loop ATPase